MCDTPPPTPTPINTNSSLTFLSWPSLMSLFISLISSLFSLQTHWQTARASTVLSIIALIKWADIFLCVTNGCWTRLIHNLWWVIDPRPAARLLWSVRLPVCHLFGFFEFPLVFSVDILMHSHSLCPFILNVYFRKGEHSFRKKPLKTFQIFFTNIELIPWMSIFFVTIGKSNTYLGLIYINLNIPFQFFFVNRKKQLFIYYIYLNSIFALTNFSLFHKTFHYSTLH